jgi:uncharacterized repeat protein (TIGR03803 family)
MLVVLLFCIAAVIASPAQTFTTLLSFNGNDGAGPEAVLQGINGNFYGTTLTGSINNNGTIFEITPAGKLTSLYRFCSQPNCTDGVGPQGGLVQATDGNFYGTTFSGGAHDSGVVFEITPGGKLTTLYSFCSKPNCVDGADPLKKDDATSKAKSASD